MRSAWRAAPSRTRVRVRAFAGRRRPERRPWTHQPRGPASAALPRIAAATARRQVATIAGNIRPFTQAVRRDFVSSRPATVAVWRIHIIVPMKWATAIDWTRQQKKAAKRPARRWTSGSRPRPGKNPEAVTAKRTARFQRARPV
jgi:hypothetical protein